MGGTPDIPEQPQQIADIPLLTPEEIARRRAEHNKKRNSRDTFVINNPGVSTNANQQPVGYGTGIRIG